jgi:hypothetical protein
VPKRATYVPKHRSVPEPSALATAPRRAVRSTVLLSTVAVAVTGVSVSGGLLSAPTGLSTAASATQPRTDATAAAAEVEPLTDRQLAERSADVVSRSADRRRAADPVKAAALREGDSPALTRTEKLTPSDPRDIARALLPEFGFSTDQFSCLDQLYNGESGWRVDADNPTSSAYGIPQALPGEKMASAGADWATNPETQIRWGLGYIRSSYGSPCGANDFKLGHGWY